MSYILESLKKSDKERQGSENPATIALANNSDFMPEKKDFSGGLSYALIAIVVVFLLFIFFWWKTSSAGREVAAAHKEKSVLLTEASVVKGVVGEVEFVQQKNAILPEAIEPKETSVTSFNEAILVDKVSDEADRLYEKNVQLAADEDVETLYRESVEPVESIVDSEQGGVGSNANISPVAQESKAINSIPSIYDLGRSAQTTIPAIAYGAHIYASDNKSGFVILNGVKRKVGEKTRSGIYVERVGEAELVLSYRGLVFSLPAMKSWNP
jgi:hypothetical protein